MSDIILMYVLLIPSVYMFLFLRGRKKNAAVVVFKGVCTAVIFAFALARAGDNTYNALIAAGLALGLAGDIAICLSFLAGMFFFAAGHFLYIAAFSRYASNMPLIMIIWIVLFAFFVAVLYKVKLNLGKFLIPGIAYAGVILLMLSMAAVLFLNHTQSGGVIFLGAVFFTASDYMLAYYTFKNKNKRLDAVCVCFYFLGQSLLAVSTAR